MKSLLKQRVQSKSKKGKYMASLMLGLLLSSTAVFANTSATIPATVKVQQADVVSVVAEIEVADQTLLFQPKRGGWDSQNIAIKSVGDINVVPEINYSTSETEKFDLPSGDITTSEKLFIKSGDEAIYDFTSPTSYKPSGDEVLTKGESVTAKISVGAGAKIPDMVTNEENFATFNVDITTTY